MPSVLAVVTVIEGGLDLVAAQVVNHGLVPHHAALEHMGAVEHGEAQLWCQTREEKGQVG